MMHDIHSGHLVGRNNDSYVACMVDEEVVQPWLRRLRSHVGEDHFATLEQNKERRDRDRTFHITVVRPNEMKKISTAGLDQIMSHDSIFFRIVGIGTASRDQNVAWFGVVDSIDIDAIRSKAGLDQINPHITFGFDQHDVHGVPKDTGTIVL